MVDKWFVTVGSIARSRIYGCSSEPGGEIGVDINKAAAWRFSASVNIGALHSFFVIDGSVSVCLCVCLSVCLPVCVVCCRSTCFWVDSLEIRLASQSLAFSSLIRTQFSRYGPPAADTEMSKGDVGCRGRSPQGSRGRQPHPLKAEYFRTPYSQFCLQYRTHTSVLNVRKSVSLLHLAY